MAYRWLPTASSGSAIRPNGRPGGRKAGVSESCTACGTRATNRSPFFREKTHRSVPQLTTEIIKAQIAHGGASKRMEQLNRSRSSADFLPPGGKARPLCSGQDRRSVDERVCAYDRHRKSEHRSMPKEPPGLSSAPVLPAAELANAVTHGIGLALSIVGAIVLIARAHSRRRRLSRCGLCTMFAMTLIAVYAASTLSHIPVGPRLRQLFRSWTRGRFTC